MSYLKPDSCVISYVHSARQVHELFHITSLDRLCSIVRSGQFKPSQSDPSGADSGINAGIVGFSISAQCIEARGVKLILEFHGVLKPPPNSFPRSVGAIYYDMVLGRDLLWRVTVPHGTTSGLVMSGLEFEPGHSWLDAILNAPWWLAHPRLKECWRRSRALKLEQEIRAILNKRLPLSVGC